MQITCCSLNTSTLKIIPFLPKRTFFQKSIRTQNSLSQNSFSVKWWDIPFVDCYKAMESQTTTILLHSEFSSSGVWAWHSRNDQPQPKSSQMAGDGWDSGWGHRSETSVLALSWVPQFCLLDCGVTKLVFHTSDAWDEKTGKTEAGCASLFLCPMQPPYMEGTGFLAAWHPQGS